MFLSKFFTKDYRSYIEKGDRHFADERYADARHAFLEALNKISDTTEEGREATEDIHRKVTETGNRLGLLNLSEAEHALSRGDAAKAEEHLGLVLEFASDPAIRAKADHLIRSVASSAHPSQPAHNCSGCSSESGAGPEEDLYAPDHLSDEERFELLIQTLPADLTARYSALGEEFARAYVLIHDGEEKAGAAILRELLSVQDDDILHYELALIEYRAGNAAECEASLRHAMTLNEANPLCWLGLVQLLADTERLMESIPLLNSMIERKLLTEQAVITLADIQHRVGNDEEAMAGYAKALTYPGTAKAAAQRLVPLLEKQGRIDEAAYVAKKYLKGCC